MLKTPMSAINEFGNRHNLIVHYDLSTQQSSATNSKEFVCKLLFTGPILTDLKVTGKGRTKKEAKHAAAYEALKVIFFNEDNSMRQLFPVPDFEIGEIKSPFDDELKENFMMTLRVTCRKNFLPLPEYKELGVEGARAKTYTMSCQIASLVEQGSAQTKWSAKQYAADLMIKKLRPIIHLEKNDVINEDANNNNTITNETESTNTESNTETIQHNIQTKNSTKIKNLNIYSKINISEYDTINTMEEMYFPLNYAVMQKSKDLEDIDAIEDPKALLEEISVIGECRFEYNRIQKTKKNNCKFYVVLNLLAPPVWTVFGSGSEFQEAEIDASRNMLKFLKDLIVNKNSNT